MSNLDQPTAATVLLAFHGEDVHQTLRTYPEVVAAIWKLCSGLLDAEVKVYTAPRANDAETLEWAVHITSPSGRRTVLARQQTLISPVRFVNA